MVNAITRMSIITIIIIFYGRPVLDIGFPYNTSSCLSWKQQYVLRPNRGEILLYYIYEEMRRTRITDVAS